MVEYSFVSKVAVGSNPVAVTRIKIFKRDFKTVVFLLILRNSLRPAVFKNFCERLLLFVAEHLGVTASKISFRQATIILLNFPLPIVKPRVTIYNT